MEIGYTWTTKIKCNWKTFWDNFNECLHCPNIHPELAHLVPMYSRRIIRPNDQPEGTKNLTTNDSKIRGVLRKGFETWSITGSTQGHI